MSRAESGLSEDLEELLESERQAMPPEGAQDRVRDRLYMSLGLVGAAGAAGSAGAAAGSAAAVKGSAGAATGTAGAVGGGATVAKAGVAKLLLTGLGGKIVAAVIGATLATTATVTVTQIRESRRREAASRNTPIAMPATPRDDVEKVNAEKANENVAKAVAAPAPAARPAHAAKTVRATTPAEPEMETATQLREERALIDQARTALRDGEPHLAISRIEEHEARFADGQLAEERESIRVRALVKSGNRSQAQKRAAAFLKRYPQSLFVGAVRDAVAE